MLQRYISPPASSQTTLSQAALVSLALVSALSLGSPLQAKPTNVVLILCDDLAYADVGCYADAVGEPIGWETPNIDRLASQGIRLTDFYVAEPICSASRCAVLTGCYANRLGIHNALGPDARHGLNPEETTIAELCKDLGYATACYGKWHLGHREGLFPTDQGFDEFYGIPYSNDMWPHHPNPGFHFPDLPLYEGTEVINHMVSPEDQTQFTRGFTQRAVDFIGEHADEPFFLYVPHPMPHVPLFTSKSFAGSSENGKFGDVIQELDWSVGQIMNALDLHGLTDDTLFIFTSDNGPWIGYGNHAGSPGPLREGKGTTFDGGVRVPFIARLPGTIPAGATTQQPVMTIDLLPTIAGLIGADLPQLEIDGHDVLPLLEQQEDAASPYAEGGDAMYFWYHEGDLEAVRQGDWKLHFPHGYRTLEGGNPGHDGGEGRYNYNVRTGLELYNLRDDVGESTDVSAEHPEIVATLSKLADAKRVELGDRLTKVKGTKNREPGRVQATTNEQKPGLQSLGFLKGTWRGTLGDTPVEEVWLAPEHGNLTGTMRWFDGSDTLRLVELFTIDKTDDGVMCRIRHFNPGLIPWESESDAPTTCRVTTIEDNRMVMESAIEGDDLVSIVYTLKNPSTLVVTLTFDDGAGPDAFDVVYTKAD